MVLDRIVISGQPMLYVATRSSMRASTMASEVKASLATVRDCLARHGAIPLGPPVVSYSDWDGRLVTIEAGYPVTLAETTQADGRVLAGHSPEGPAAVVIHRESPTTLATAWAQFNTELAICRARVTGLSWEVYLYGDGFGPGCTTALYVQLLESPVLSHTTISAAV